MYWVRQFVFLTCLISVCCPFKGVEGWLFSSLPKEVVLENKQNKELEKFANILAQKHGMKLLLTGTGHLVDQKDTRKGFSFIDGCQMTIEQGRPIAVSMINAFWHKFNNDPLFETYMLRSERPRLFFSYAFGMKISYWDKNYDRPLAPFLSQIRVIEDKIQYYYASPKDQSLELTLTETIADAMKVVCSSENRS